MGNDVDLANAFFVEAFAPEHREDPYDLYRRMREQGPFVTGAAGTHLAFGHDDCWAALRHPAVSSDERHSAVFRQLAETDDRLAAAMTRRPLLVFMDPPDHTRLRALVTQAFTPRRVEQLRTTIQDRTNELVAALPANAAVDLVAALASPLPIAVICDLLGIPTADHSHFRAWSAALTKSIDPGVLRSESDNLARRSTSAVAPHSPPICAEGTRRPDLGRGQPRRDGEQREPANHIATSATCGAAMLRRRRRPRTRPSPNSSRRRGSNRADGTDASMKSR